MNSVVPQKKPKLGIEILLQLLGRQADIQGLRHRFVVSQSTLGQQVQHPPHLGIFPQPLPCLGSRPDAFRLPACLPGGHPLLGADQHVEPAVDTGLARRRIELDGRSPVASELQLPCLPTTLRQGRLRKRTRTPSSSCNVRIEQVRQGLRELSLQRRGQQFGGVCRGGFGTSPHQSGGRPLKIQRLLLRVAQNGPPGLPFTVRLPSHRQPV